MRSVAVVYAVAVAAALVAVACAMPIADELAQPVPGAGAANFTGYVVTGQWDGRTFPSPQWAFDLTRQDTSFRLKQELQLAQLIPTTAGNGLAPSFSAYDSGTRAYFLTTARSPVEASLWGFTVANDVASARPIAAEVRYSFPADGATLVGLQVFPTAAVADGSDNSHSNANALTVLAFFNTPQGNCTVLSVDYTSGSTSVWLDNACATNGSAADVRQLTTAIDRTGTTLYAISDLAQFQGAYGGNLEFTADDFLEDDDTWTNSAYDATTKQLYFQCSDVDPDSGEVTIAMCQLSIPLAVSAFEFVNIAIEPMTYGYVGFEYVQVVA